MDHRYITNILLLLILVLVQVLICNQIMLFDMAMAFVFIYVVISLPMDLKTDWLLTWAFLSGLTVDLFSDTPGLNALACTLLAMTKRPVLYAYIPRDDHTKDIVPSLRNLGFSIFAKYLLTMSAIYCTLVFTIEYFNFAGVREVVLMAVSSAALTFLVLLGLDCIIVSKREKRL